MVNLRENMWYLAFQPLETSYLHYQIAYNQQTYLKGLLLI